MWLRNLAESALKSQSSGEETCERQRKEVLVSGFLADRGAKGAARNPAMTERFRRRTGEWGAACCLALAAIAGAALAQERPAEQTRTPTPPAGNVESGKRLYVRAGCVLCHNGEGQGGGPGPRLAPNPNMLAFVVFVQRTRDPINSMPPYTSKVLSDQQLADIYAFLQTVPKPPDVSTIPLLQ
jgi:mono/diheme cytochrome c family protein